MSDTSEKIEVWFRRGPTMVCLATLPAEREDEVRQALKDMASETHPGRPGKPVMAWDVDRRIYQRFADEHGASPIHMRQIFASALEASQALGMKGNPVSAALRHNKHDAWVRGVWFRYLEDMPD